MAPDILMALERGMVCWSFLEADTVGMHTHTLANTYAIHTHPNTPKNTHTNICYIHKHTPHTKVYTNIHIPCTHNTHTYM